MNHRTLGLFVSLFIGVSSYSQDLVYHHPDSQSLTSLSIQNPHNESVSAWLLFYEGQYLDELEVVVPARSTRKVNLHEIKKDNWDVALITKRPVRLPSDWKLQKNTFYEIDLLEENSLLVQYLNLSFKKQKIEITYFNANREVLKTESFTSAGVLKSLTRKEIHPEGARYLQVKSASSLMLQTKNPVRELIDSSREADPQAVHFLVSNGPGSSFVAPIKDPQLIERARAEIQKFQGYIVFANIDFNENQANRNFFSPAREYWSWSIREVTALSQIGADWCVAYPEMIERMLHNLVSQKAVCFRGQRIIRELTPAEVQTGILDDSPAHQ